MEGTYCVKLGSETKGSVSLVRQGLYWSIACSCSLTGEVMYDLAVIVDDRKERLGLLTPDHGTFSLRAMVPIKRLGQGSPTFFLQARHGSDEVQFYPVTEQEPFCYLHRLEDAYMAKQNEKIGLFFHEKNINKKSKIMLDK